MAPAISHRTYSPEELPPALVVAKQRAFEQFLNDYVAYLFVPEMLSKVLQTHFYEVAMDVARTIQLVMPHQTNVDLFAAQLTEEMKQKAARRAQEMNAVATSVLVDQRNYILARHINEEAWKCGVSNTEMMSGTDTNMPSPRRAFAYKLSADSSLSRGPACGLVEDSITSLSESIRTRAQDDITHFLEIYKREREGA